MRKASPPARPPHDRRLGLVGISLTTARANEHALEALSYARDRLEAVLLANGYFEDAPFSWVTIAIRYGLKNEDAPHVLRINKRYGDLPLAIELDTNRISGATLEELKDIFVDTAARALLVAGHRYRRPLSSLNVLAQCCGTQTLAREGAR